MAGEESDRVEGAEYLLLSGHLQIFVGFIVLSIILLCDGTGHCTPRTLNAINGLLKRF